MFHGGTLLFGVGAAAQAKAFDLSIQARAVVFEDLGGPFDIASGAFERLRDGLTFDLFHREIRWDHAAKLALRRAVKVLR